MTRQAVIQHLNVLENARLVATSRRGREKLHFLNPVPLQQIYDRWISTFERPRDAMEGVARRRVYPAKLGSRECVRLAAGIRMGASSSRCNPCGRHPR